MMMMNILARMVVGVNHRPVTNHEVDLRNKVYFSTIYRGGALKLGIRIIPLLSPYGYQSYKKEQW